MSTEPLDLDAIRERWAEFMPPTHYEGTSVALDVCALVAEVEALRTAVAAAERRGYERAIAALRAFDTRHRSPSACWAADYLEGADDGH